MLSEFSYPIICSQKFEKTVAFYEDYFDFTPEFEMHGFVILKRQNWNNMYLAIIDSKHSALPDAYKKPAQGIILNYPVKNADDFHNYAYHEGLSLMSEPKDALCGRKHFYIEDPNNILIDVAENINIESLISSNENLDIRVLQAS